MPENQEYGMEEYENKVESIVEVEECNEQKERMLERAITKIEKDPDLAKFLENEQIQLQEKKIELKDKKNELISLITSIEKEIKEHRNQICEEKQNLSFLIEDEEEVEKLFSDRELYLNECESRIKQVKEKLRVSNQDTDAEEYIMYTERELEIIRKVELEEDGIIELGEEKSQKERKLIEPKESGVLQYVENEKYHFFPNAQDAVEKMHEYGCTYVEYRNGYPDFSKFVMHNSEWGILNGQVEIPNMTDRRYDRKMESGKRRSKIEMLDVASGISNFTQADLALVDQIIGNNKSLKMIEKDSDEYIEMKYNLLKGIRKFRKDNGLTWHEVADGMTMQLIPTCIHKACPHSGGIEIMEYANEFDDWEYL